MSADAQSFKTEPDGSRIVTLEKGFDGPRGTVREIRLRPPTYRDFRELNGDPSTLIVGSNAMIPYDDMAIIHRYVERLSDGDPNLFDGLTVRDAMALRDAVKSFFQARSGEASTASPTS